MDDNSVAIGDLRLNSQQRTAVGYLAEFAKRVPQFGFSESRAQPAALNVVKEIFRVTDEVLTSTLSSRRQPACDLGCHWCCYLRVKVTPLELLYIADFIRIWWGREEISSFRQRLAVADASTRGLDGIARVRSGIACPLLQDGMCSVYPARPIACRFYHSLNQSECEAPLDDDQRSVIHALVEALAVGAPDSLETHFRPSWESAGDDGARLRVVVDQVASLTDTSVVAWYRRHCR